MREPQLSAESDVPALVNPDAVDASSLRNEPSEVRLERFTARAAGKLVAVALMLTGIGLVGFLTEGAARIEP
jgi:hypothetical protein